jgi:hypothetical protein
MRSSPLIRSVISFLWICITVPAMGMTTEEEQRTQLTLEIRVLAGTKQHPTLALTLSSREQERVQISVRSLPWHGDSTLRLVLLDCSDRTVLTEFLPIDDPGPDPEPVADILPGRHLAGQVDLSQRFPGLVDHQNHDLVLFWTYQPVAYGRAPGRRAGGWLAFRVPSP